MDMGLTTESELAHEIFSREVLKSHCLHELQMRLLWTHRLLLIAYQTADSLNAQLEQERAMRSRYFREFMAALDSLGQDVDRLDALIDESPQGVVEALLMGGDYD